MHIDTPVRDWPHSMTPPAHDVWLTREQAIGCIGEMMVSSEKPWLCGKVTGSLATGCPAEGKTTCSGHSGYRPAAS